MAPLARSLATCLLSTLLSLASALPSHPGTPTELAARANPSFVQVNNAHIFDPPASWASWRVVYERNVQLNDGSLLASWESYPPEPPLVAAPIWKSTDGGKSFFNFSQVTDQVNGWGMRYQPFLYVLPAAFAGLEAGDLLFAGNSVPASLNGTKIDVYSSADGGLTWKFLSNVVTGGYASVSDDDTPVWEPHLLLRNGRLICYYSDQRDPNYSQKLSHKVTTDLHTWSAAVDDVTGPVESSRPGMTTVVQIGDGQWIMTFEYCGCQNCAGNCQVHYKVADDPEQFGPAAAQPLVAADGTTTFGSPYVTWVFNGGANGSIIANGNSDAFLYINKGRAAPGSVWTRVNANTDQAYSRCLHPLGDFKSIIIGGAGNFQTGQYANNVTYSIVDLGSIGIN